MSDLEKFGFAGGFDPSTVKDDILPKGTYRAKITQTETRADNKSGFEFLSITLDVFHPFEYQGRKIFHRLQLDKRYSETARKIATQHLKEYADAIGCGPGKPLMQTSQLIGHDVVVSTKVREYNGKDYVDVSRVARFVRANGEVAASSSANATAGANVDPF